MMLSLDLIESMEIKKKFNHVESHKHYDGWQSDAKVKEVLPKDCDKRLHNLKIKLKMGGKVLPLSPPASSRIAGGSFLL